MSDQSASAAELAAECQALRNRISELEEERQEIHDLVVEACYDALEDAGIADRPDGGGQPDYLLPSIVSSTLDRLFDATLLYSPGVIAIGRERDRQVTAEGWTPDHDDAHDDGSMALAACCYAEMSACMALEHDLAVRAYGNGHQHWPWAQAWWKPTTARRNLEKAGALIAAEIERLDRAAGRQSSAKNQGTGQADPRSGKPT